MPRPKGSKNKKTATQSVAAPVAEAVETIEEKINSINAEIAALNDQLKAKKAELKVTLREKAKADKAAANQKA